MATTGIIARVPVMGGVVRGGVADTKALTNYVKPGIPAPAWGGTGVLRGTVRARGKVLSAGTAVLFTEAEDYMVASQPLVSGIFEFNGLNKAISFYVVVKNADTGWEHIVTSRRKPA